MTRKNTLYIYMRSVYCRNFVFVFFPSFFSFEDMFFPFEGGFSFIALGSFLALIPCSFKPPFPFLRRFPDDSAVAGFFSTTTISPISSSSSFASTSSSSAFLPSSFATATAPALTRSDSFFAFSIAALRVVIS